MTNKFQKTTADSLMTDHRWLVHLTFLLQDLLTPGSSVNVIIQALEPLKLPAKKCGAWDLSCEKRAVSVQLAQEFESMCENLCDDSLSECGQRKSKLWKLKLSELCGCCKKEGITNTAKQFLCRDTTSTLSGRPR